MTHVLICGAGIAGVSTAYQLSVRYGVKDILLVDPRPPLTLTSDKSTEAYRNWWPGPDGAMVSLMNHSIQGMEHLARLSHNRFLLNRRGYVYATAQEERAQELIRAAENAAQWGGGPLRVHSSPRALGYRPSPTEGWKGVPDGVDILTHPTAIRTYFPYLNSSTRLVLHVRRAGWLSAQQMGMLMLELAREHGVRLLTGEVVGVETQAGRVHRVHVRTARDRVDILTEVFVNAAGPFVRHVAQLLGVDLPILWEPHAKVVFNDYLRVLPREAPLLIWSDPQHIPWDAEEQAFLAESEEGRELLKEFPAGVHARPEGPATSTMVLMLWDYATSPVESPRFPLEFDPVYPDVVLRGMTTMVPALRTYWDRVPKPVVDGGYYTKTRENLPLIGPLPVEGSFVIGALSGFGIMSAWAAGDLLATYITGREVPAYARAFHPNRYTDSAFYPLLRAWQGQWQL